MPNTTQKHRDFVGEPMGDKDVTELPGIGEVLGARLEHQGYDKVGSGPDVGAQVLHTGPAGGAVAPSGQLRCNNKKCLCGGQRSN